MLSLPSSSSLPASAPATGQAPLPNCGQQRERVLTPNVSPAHVPQACRAYHHLTALTRSLTRTSTTCIRRFPSSSPSSCRLPSRRLAPPRPGNRLPAPKLGTHACRPQTPPCPSASFLLRRASLSGPRCRSPRHAVRPRHSAPPREPAGPGAAPGCSPWPRLRPRDPNRRGSRRCNDAARGRRPLSARHPHVPETSASSRALAADAASRISASICVASRSVAAADGGALPSDWEPSQHDRLGMESLPGEGLVAWMACQLLTVE